MQEPIPEGKAGAGAAGAASTGGGDGGGLFIPSATAGNIHTAEIPQRKRNLIQTPSAGIVEPCSMGSRMLHLEAHIFQYTAHLLRHKVIHSVNMKHIQGCANVNGGRLFLRAWM